MNYIFPGSKFLNDMKQGKILLHIIEIINNKARHNLIDAKCRWRSDQLDGAVVVRCLGTPGETKVSGDRQTETTHASYCLAAKCRYSFDFLMSLLSCDWLKNV